MRVIHSLSSYNQTLLIYQFQETDCQLQTQSRYFPGIDLAAVIAQAMQVAYDRNTSAAIRQLRQQLASE